MSKPATAAPAAWEWECQCRSISVASSVQAGFKIWKTRVICYRKGVGRGTQDFYRSAITLLPTAIYYKCLSIPAPNTMCQTEKEANHCGVSLCLLLVASSVHASPPILLPNIELQHRGKCLSLRRGMAESHKQIVDELGPTVSLGSKWKREGELLLRCSIPHILQHTRLGGRGMTRPEAGLCVCVCALTSLATIFFTYGWSLTFVNKTEMTQLQN